MNAAKVGPLGSFCASSIRLGIPGSGGGAGRMSVTRESCFASRPIWVSSPSGSAISVRK